MSGTSNGRPALNHVGVFAVDVEAVAGFYSEFLGMQVTDRGITMGVRVVFLSADPRQHHQLVVAEARQPGQPSTVAQLSFEIPDLASLRALVGRLHAAGLDPYRVVDHGTSWSAYVNDPEGNPVELYVTTPWYVPQPCAEPLDLSEADDVIVARTEGRCCADPHYRPMAEWTADMHRSLAGTEAW